METNTNTITEDIAILEGVWNVEGENLTTGDKPHTPVTGTQVVKKMEGYNFLESRWDYDFQTNMHVGISIIGSDNDNPEPRVHSFDNLGYHREYQLEIDGSTWKYLGDAERATIEFKDSGNVYEEYWEMKKGEEWLPLCRRTGTRI